jgi:hypothetical protein
MNLGDFLIQESIGLLWLIPSVIALVMVIRWVRGKLTPCCFPSPACGKSVPQEGPMHDIVIYSILGCTFLVCAFLVLVVLLNELFDGWNKLFHD